MPVEPLPCADGGGGGPVEVTTCCSPSIDTSGLCLPDGTPVLLVVRSGCADCGTAAADPEVVGWIDPATGTLTAGAPAGAGPCQSTCATVATAQLCDLQPDGTCQAFLRHLVRDCDGTITSTLDTTLDAVTPYTVTGTAADCSACAAACVETICVQRCDDTDSDGAADATYSELWCIAADGTASLLLTYTDDPSTPYTPVAPVECTYGCPESETVTLCDDSGPFLRRYRFLQGAASYEDVELDGMTPHVVTGTAGVCDTSEPCEQPTTPAATLGLCLADGTPIAVVVTRDCAGVVSRDGWINLATGAWSAGEPPAGTMACGDSRSITVAGTFCDVDPVTGDVHGLVLVEYSYAADGSVESVRLVDAVTGATYTPQGDITTCPAGAAQPERDLAQLCDTDGDGNATPFVRDYARDENGAITGHSDYLLDGTPYTATGTVGLCQPDAEPCRDTTTVLLCDTAEQEALTVFDPINRPGDDGWEIVSFAGQPGFGPEQPLPYPAVHPPGNPAYMGARSDMSAGPNVGPWTGYESAPLRWVMRKTFVAPQDGVATVSSVGFRGDGGARVRVNNTDAGMYGQWNQPATAGTAQIPVTAGPNTIEIEVRDIGGANWITGRLDVAMVQTRQFMRTVTVDCESGEVVATTDTTLDGEPYTPTGEVGQCEPVTECCEQPPPETRVDVESDVLCIQDADGEILGQVLVERVYDDQSGDRVVQRLADPTTGEEVVLPDGASLTLCQEPPCPVAFATECVGAVTRSEASYDNTALIGTLPGQCGSVQGPIDPPNTGPNFGCFGGPYTVTSWVVNGVEIIAEGGGVTFQGGPCGPGTPGNPGMHLNWAQALTNLDPTGATWVVDNEPACAWYIRSEGGSGSVYGPMTITGDGMQVTDGTWILGPVQSCEETQYTKVYSQQCDGTVTVSWLDAQGEETAPPVGELVPCGTGCGSGGGQGLDVETLTLCDIAPDGGSVPFLRHVTYGTGGQVVTVVDTALDGFAPYTPTGNVGLCQPESEPCRNTSTLLVCDLPGDGEPTPTVTDTSPAPYDAGTPGTDPVGGGAAALWSGGVLAIPPDMTAASDGSVQRLRSFAATVQAPRPGCDTGNATVTASIRVERDGPDPGCLGTGMFALIAGGAPVATVGVNPPSIPVGTVQVLTVSATVPAADLAAGNVALVGRLETYHHAPGSSSCAGTGPGGARIGGWTVDEFTAEVAYDQAGCGEQILATVVTDCETGQVESVSYTLLDGTPYTPVGEVGECQAAGGSACCPAVSVETITLCDVAGDGTVTSFLRHLTYTEGSPVPAVADTGLDGVTPYSPAGTVGRCQTETEGRDVEITPMCVVDNASGAVIQRILAEVTYDTATGDRLAVTYVDPVTWGPIAMPGGTHLDVCPQDQPDPVPDAEVLQLCDVDGDTRVPFLRHLIYPAGATTPTVVDTLLDGTTPYVPAGQVGECDCPQHLLTECRWDDTDSDGIGDTGYLELIAVDGCTGALTSLGTYLPDLTGPYTPVSPVPDGPVEGAPPARGVQARRVELAPGGSWDAAGVVLLQSVTAAAHGGDAQVTTADGTSTLFAGESVTWSVVRDTDAALTGPLTITALSTPVTITYTRGVQL